TTTNSVSNTVNKEQPNNFSSPEQIKTNPAHDLISSPKQTNLDRPSETSTDPIYRLNGNFFMAPILDEDTQITNIINPQTMGS
ncbi:15390_t:CDS:1, partial [Dentiscutata heterogama]